MQGLDRAVAEWMIWIQVLETEGKGSLLCLLLLHFCRNIFFLKYTLVWISVLVKVEMYRLRHWPFLFLLRWNKTQEMCSYPETHQKERKEKGKKRSEPWECFSEVRIEVGPSVLWQVKGSHLELWLSHCESFLKEFELLFFGKAIKIWKPEEATQCTLNFL